MYVLSFQYDAGIQATDESYMFTVLGVTVTATATVVPETGKALTMICQDDECAPGFTEMNKICMEGYFVTY